MSKAESKATKAEKPKSSKLDKAKQSEIKEKQYTTKQVETSISILESPENDVVLEALLFLSKYADISKNNISYLIKKDLLTKLVKNFHKNICIFRMSLRLISLLLDVDIGICEIDQDKYDDKIIEITNFYIEHKDAHVREFCIEILAKIATSCRINTLIFKVDLLNPIFDNIKSTKNLNILYYTLLLFFRLMDTPAAVCALPESKNFDQAIVVQHLNHQDLKISNLVLEILEKLTKYCLPFLQEGFKKVSLMEKMLKIIMDDERHNQHDKVIQIIHNCLRSEETCSYYIESIEFLEFCQWIKSCNTKFLLPMADIFIKLTGIPEIKQILFDLSVEESILFFFRYTDKKVINKTCEAVSNMTTHKFCCKHMLTPVVASTLLEVLERQNDEDDPYNQVALKTVFHFIRRNVKALDIFLGKDFKPILLGYFYNKAKLISDESFVMILEIIYKCIVHPAYQDEFVTVELLRELLELFQSPNVQIATFCCEMLTNLTSMESMRKIFLEAKGPKIFMDAMNSNGDFNFLTQILYFIFSSLIYEDLAMAFLHNGLVPSLKSFSEYLQSKVPICKKVLHLALNYYPPMKFYETGRLEVTDKLPNKFYVINGVWSGPFPFLEVLEGIFVSPYKTIFIVDFSYEVVTNCILEAESQITLSSSTSTLKNSRSSMSTAASVKEPSDFSVLSAPSVFDINYGRVSKDPFLPRYIYHIKKYESFVQGNIEERIRFLAEYIDTLLCGPKENLSLPEKIHEYKLHIECLKNKLGTNIIPVGYLRLGFHCEKALLFKALADKICIPCSLVRGSLNIYWNEVALFEGYETEEKVKFYVVDLMENFGNLMPVGSREANKYCNLN